jgi:hypothetical protein
VAKTPLASRRDRLASALRANLRRRKAGQVAERGAGANVADADKDADRDFEPADGAPDDGEALATAHKPR